MYSEDLLQRKAKSFVLWNPGVAPNRDPPRLRLGKFDARTGSFSEHVHQALSPAPGKPGLWELKLYDLTPPLTDGVYHYWFEIAVTDPLAFTVDYSYATNRDDQPPAIIKVQGETLVACDIDGSEPSRPAIHPTGRATLPANNRLVIYELPTSWAKAGNNERGIDIDVGTFSDVKALFDVGSRGDRFSSLSVVRDQAILDELGINALELLPAADARVQGEWGYATANYFAPDFDLGPASELVSLVDTLTGQGTRLFTDVVMAFGHDPYGVINFPEFHIRSESEPKNADSFQSHAVNQRRQDWGGNLWRYIRETESYDPVSGETRNVYPSWAFHKLHLTRWMTDFAVGGIRIDSVNNIANWDFVRAYKNHAWELYNTRFPGEPADASKFLVIGEELSMPIDMVRQGYLDALWNEPWQQRLRAVLIGQGARGDNFEWTLRKVIDCRLDQFDGGRGFENGAQAVNYITSHDIEGFGSEKKRFFHFCEDKGIWDVAKRAKLAFVMLLTSVGIPMIFAGEEFADKQDRSQDMRLKQTDPVNYGRLKDGAWREELFGFVANLVKFRISCPALAVDDTEVFHIDRSRGARVMAWKRGDIRIAQVVVVANFTDQHTPESEYVIPNWPEKDQPGWREVTQGRHVPPEWVGREPLMPWEAKVYTRWQ